MCVLGRDRVRECDFGRVHGCGCAVPGGQRVVVSSLGSGLGRRRGVHHELGGGNGGIRRSHRAGDGLVRKARFFHQRLHLSDDCQRLAAADSGECQRRHQCGRVVDRHVDDQVGDGARIGVGDIAGMAAIDERTRRTAIRHAVIVVGDDHAGNAERHRVAVDFAGTVADAVAEVVRLEEARHRLTGGAPRSPVPGPG